MTPHLFQQLHRSVSWQKNLREHDVLIMSQARIYFILVIVSLCAFALSFRLVDIMLMQNGPQLARTSPSTAVMRHNITDRHNEIIATQLITASVSANPQKIIDIEETVNKLTTLLPNIDRKTLKKRLMSKRSFVWVARHITPKIQAAIHNSGIPGIDLVRDEKRVYPHGKLMSHPLGLCNHENVGSSGLEKQFDHHLLQNDLHTTLDVRTQYATIQTLQEGIQHFKAKAGNAIVMDITNGEILSLVSLPTYDPNSPDQIDGRMFNRNTQGVYEVGSTFKIFNIAIALESGRANINSRFDASQPIKIGRFTVTDFRGPNRVITLQEAFTLSSNIAMIQIARSYGAPLQKKYLKDFGMLDCAHIELPEVAKPLFPKNWQETSMMSISYGYGISVTPIQTAAAVAGIVNDGMQALPTLIKNKNSVQAKRVISSKTSTIIRRLMRQVVLEGTGRKANAPGYGVFAKTGTAYQAKNGSYGKRDARTTSAIAVFPYDKPKYLVLIMLDDPKGLKETSGFATAGWNAASLAGKLVAKIAPILNIKPKFDPLDQILTKIKT